MTDYSELVKALRWCAEPGTIIDECDTCDDCPYSIDGYCGDCMNNLVKDAAAAIEELQAEVRFWEAAVKGQEDGIKVLQAEVKRLKECNDELREAQTYIDHYGDRWLTSAKDVPTAAYEHGYADGRDEAMAKMEVQDG